MSVSLDKNDALLQVENLLHQYGDKLVLSLNAWYLEPFEHQLLLGPSGSGKTTLLGILSGLLRPSAGSVSALGKTLTDMSVGDLSSFRARNIGFVFQDHHLISSLTIGENMRLARQLADLPEDPDWTAHLLGQLGLSSYHDTKPASLSHGEAQRAAIARAAVTKPPLLLADEPTSALDDDNTQKVMELLQALSKEAGSTMLVASHDQRLKSFFSSSLVLGKLQEEKQ